VRLLRLIPFAALGGLMAVLAGAVFLAPPGPRTTAAAPTSTPASASPSVHECATATVHLALETSILPHQLWVHVSDGVNLRTAAGITSARIETLRQGTVLAVDVQQRAADGSTWDHVKAPDGSTGWVSDRYVVSYSIHPASAGPVTLWVPVEYTLQTVGVGVAQIQRQGLSIDLLATIASTPIDGPMPQQSPPPGYAGRTAWVYDHAEGVLVGDHSASDSIYRVLNVYCTATVHEITLTTAKYHYDFVFFTDQKTAHVVREVLDSAAVQ
jgi:hypothetical protein